MTYIDDEIIIYFLFMDRLIVKSFVEKYNIINVENPPYKLKDNFSIILIYNIVVLDDFSISLL